MRVRVRHTTTYNYPEPAALGPHIVRLHPGLHRRAAMLSYNLGVAPDCEVKWQYDPWNNRIARLTFKEGAPPLTRLELKVEACFEVRPVNPFDFFIDDRCEHVPFAYPDGLAEELAPYLEKTELGPRTRAWVEAFEPPKKTIDFLVALNGKLAADNNYIIRLEPGIQTGEQTLERGSGSCRDLAVLAVDILREHGIAARFVSGYLIQLTDEGNIPDLARGVSSDVVDLHAWAEAYIPGGGWVGLDATSGLLCGEGHIPLACAASPALAAPVSGTSSVGAESLDFEMTVERLGHEPRPRKPYTDEQWEAIRQAGAAVDERLLARGLRLTVGGEPTWTSREHPAEPEWNTEALGPTKLRAGFAMAAELRQRMGTGTVPLHRMGKWYPGESLPRWGIDLIWRSDEVPIWLDPARLDLEPRAPFKGPGLDEALERSRRVALALARGLGVAPELTEAFEDPWHFLKEELDLPGDVDPLSADLEDPEERRRLARVLSRGLGRAVGYVLPLWREPEGWISARWTFRAGRMLLIPGDSPMGLRLPLDRLGEGGPELHLRDVTTPQAPFAFDPGQQIFHSRLSEEPGGGRQPQQAMAPRLKGEPFRTAVCIEPREGGLNVFLPPVTDAQHFLELVGAVEAAAAAEDVAVRLEGYPPPTDPRVHRCSITPDPGVIEVNMPVCHSFDEYVDTLDLVNDAANHAGLCSERFLIDGREVGSGGGHHITLGGPSTAESPFLQRPDLLASQLRFIQNHPSLSYLFTGLFVGPTSQAPRFDEARHDALYELELALSRVPGPDQSAGLPPWTVDRMLRNLLVDVSGNTHRTEVCIDKLYDPRGVAGRLGILEFRAFEMPPHERMAAAQIHLMRALTSRFAEEPYTAPLVPWGNALHDRFMLPHYLWDDFKDVCRDLQDHQVPIDPEWYRPFLDHKFPIAGAIETDALRLELRSALEPWPVLGEEAGGAAVSRYVDSSLERLQVRAEGVYGDRYQVLVNGLHLPMRPTATEGEKIAGLRFRAWQPPHCLQPDIGIHHPLRFDLVDTWGKRSLGAATYHVWHPEGQGFEEPPLTAFEAAARRAQRFTTEGHAPFPVVPAPTQPSAEHPITLDLRRFPIDRPMPRE